RRVKPTVQKEAAGGNTVIESVLWDTAPSYLCKLDAQCCITLVKKLPVETAPIKFASWIGGDHDGNPNCTPAVTLRVAKLFLGELKVIYLGLTMSSRFSEELKDLAPGIRDSFDKKEKYRRVIGHLRRRLVHTIKDCEAKLRQISNKAFDVWHGNLLRASGWGSSRMGGCRADNLDQGAHGTAVDLQLASGDRVRFGCGWARLGHYTEGGCVRDDNGPPGHSGGEHEAHHGIEHHHTTAGDWHLQSASWVLRGGTIKLAPIQAQQPPATFPHPRH
ncbi:hypothetical protein ACHAWF_000766, partial [Thalassiosira exigua]